MHALTPPAATDRRQTRLILVRANGPLFYSIAIASFLESVAADEGERLLIGPDAATAEWIRAAWLPRKRDRAAALRRYIEQCWPEFDWENAFEQYRALLGQGGGAPYRATAAREVLGRCTNAAQAGLFYRALSRWSDDHALRAFARDAAVEETDAFARLRKTFEARARREGLGWIRAWRTVRSSVRYARDTRVRLAFEALQTYCSVNSPFPTLEYREFLERMRPVIARCACPVWSERMLFSDWGRGPAVAAPAPTRGAPATRFRPVFAQAA